MMKGGSLYKQTTDSWLPIKKSDYFHMEVYNPELEDGIYELIGPEIKGNPERIAFHMLMKHGDVVLSDVPRDYEGLRKYLTDHDIEGIVFYHSDGRMVKIKKRDFGVKR